MIPAVKGTETLLTTALKSGPQLSSVVVTSSVVAIVNPTDVPGHVFTKEHYASVALDRANKERGGNVTTPGIVLYSASKTAADRAVWQFKKDHKVRLFESLRRLISPFLIYSKAYYSHHLRFHQ